VHIAYQVLGHGDRDIVIVPGLISHLDLWWEDPYAARFYRRLASLGRLIMFDKRDTGLSDRAVGEDTAEQRIEDVRAVMRACGSDRAVLFGYSEGGPMSILFAARYPERVTALILGAVAGCAGLPVRAADGGDGQRDRGPGGPPVGAGRQHRLVRAQRGRLARRPPLAGALGADGRQPERHLADDKDDPGDRRA
jgi:pimeloyl-ACP methyl ester carboxylesterase